MEMLVFATKVQHAVREALGEEYHVELKEVRKNNGVILQGLVIRRGEDNIMPTIYLNSFLTAYEQGITFADITARSSLYTEMMQWEKRSISLSFVILRK